MPENAPGVMPENEQPNSEMQPADFEAWLAGQPDGIRASYAEHTRRLKSALDGERAGRAELSKEIKVLAAKAEKGSALEQTLADATAKLEQAERRAAFYEDAGKPEIGCSNPKAAFLVALADNLFDRKGGPDWAAIKAAAPELFGRRAPQGNAGVGTGSPPTPAMTMNEMIRRQAGR